MENNDINRKWYVFYTRPKFEKKVDLQLKELDIQTFLPLRTVTKYWSDRKKQIDEPLFPSYIFVNVNPQEREIAFQPEGIVRMLGDRGIPTVIPEHQINSVKSMVTGGFNPQPYNSFVEGDEIEIIDGPLCGNRGIVYEERKKKTSLFIVSMKDLHTSIYVEIPKCQVKKI